VTDPGVRARALLMQDGIAVSAWADGPGDRYAAHAHDFDKILVIVEGSISIRLIALGTTQLLQAGDRLDLPAGMSHAAEVGPAGVRCLEGHLAAGSLPREALLLAGWATTAPAVPGRQTDSDAET
jgi:hypothetical protein